MKKLREVIKSVTPIVWPRADPEKLKDFDPRTKYCIMNCGPHRDDPRSRAERIFLCNDCQPNQPEN